jgi:hypothetical protein
MVSLPEEKLQLQGVGDTFVQLFRLDATGLIAVAYTLRGGRMDRGSLDVLLIAEHQRACSLTLRIHRSKVMHKMEADCLPDLVRMAATLRIHLP